MSEHFQSNDRNHPLTIVSGTAGTYVRLLLTGHLCVSGPTGVAACNVDGSILHSSRAVLILPIKEVFKELEGKHLQDIQQSMAVGRKILGRVDRRLRQVLPLIEL